MNSDDELSKFLQERNIPKPSSNLAYRICQRAEESMNRKAITHLSLVQQILTMFVIPKPVYVIAFCLLFGLAVGFYSGESDVSTQEWFSFLEIEEGDLL